ncbi:ribonuclease H-like domain-containing protein, partial [Tanacetum coccineum]
MALPEDHLAKFHKMTDAKEMWEAIKSRFGGNDESKKMQKYILKQQFEGFSVSNSEGLHKGYDRSLPSAWSQVSLIMRTKPGVDSLSFDDLYNNLRVFENDVKGSTASSSSTQNVAFVSENTSSTNDVSTAYGVCPQLDHEDLEQLDEFDLEEMDLKWQVAMISMRMKKFYKKTGRKLQFDAKEPVGFDKTKVECYNCHKTGHFARECRTKGNQDSKRRDAWNSGNKDGRRSGKQEDSKALVTIDGEGVDWTSHSEEEEDYALMACNSSGSDTEVQSCSNECVASYNKLKKLYDEQRAQLSDANIEIQAYTQALKKVEAQLVAHQQGQLWYEEKIRFMKIDLDDKTDVLTYHKKLLAEAEKEKEDLKAKVEKWHNSSKNLGKLLNTQMSANDKFGLGYGDHIYDGILSYENEVLQSVFMNKESDLENQPLYDRFVTTEGMHAVPPPMTGNYMPSGPDIEIDYSQFTYGPKQSQPSESETQTSEYDTCESNISIETPELVSEPVVNEPNVNRNNLVLLVLITVLTRTGKILVNTTRASGTNNVSTTRHNLNRQAVPSNGARKVNTVKPIMNNAKVNTVKPMLVLLGEKGKLLLSPQQVVIRDQKDISGTKSPNTMVDQDLEIVLLSKIHQADPSPKRLGHMTGSKAYLAEYQDFNGGPVVFGGSKGYITWQKMCDKKNKVLFIDTECLILSPEFKLPDENQALLRIPRQNNMYSFNLENIVPSGGLAYLIANATIDESNKWHRRLGHVNFKNLNKLV